MLTERVGFMLIERGGRHLVPLVRAGVVFEKGVMAERSEEDENEVAA